MSGRPSLPSAGLTLPYFLFISEHVPPGPEMLRVKMLIRSGLHTTRDATVRGIFPRRTSRVSLRRKSDRLPVDFAISVSRHIRTQLLSKTEKLRGVESEVAFVDTWTVGRNGNQWNVCARAQFSGKTVCFSRDNKQVCKIEDSVAVMR